MALLLKKQTASILFSLFSLLLTVTACKKNPDSQPIPVPENTPVEINGKPYPVLTIGDQIWTIANYAGTGGISYKNGNEKPEYGRYYTFEEAKSVTLPDGWRLPNMADYITLAESQGVVFTNLRATAQETIKKLASKSNWRTIAGTNASGFNAYPAGYSYQNSEPLDGDICEFWMADGNTISIQESATGKAHNIMFYSTGTTGYRFNLRFVRNK
jgi:uncharacterized protein (TIGR02145 family)